MPRFTLTPKHPTGSMRTAGFTFAHRQITVVPSKDNKGALEEIRANPYLMEVDKDDAKNAYPILGEAGAGETEERHERDGREKQEGEGDEPSGDDEPAEEPGDDGDAQVAEAPSGPSRPARPSSDS